MLDKVYYQNQMRHNIRRNAVEYGHHVKFNMYLGEHGIEELKCCLREDFPNCEFKVKQARKYLHIERVTYDFDDDYPATRECDFGTGYHVGGGVYSDDDGDNWDFW